MNAYPNHVPPHQCPGPVDLEDQAVRPALIADDDVLLQKLCRCVKYVRKVRLQIYRVQDLGLKKSGMHVCMRVYIRASIPAGHTICM